jgi:hypothetical protein
VKKVGYGADGSTSDAAHAAVVGRSVRLGRRPALHRPENDRFALARYVRPAALDRAPSSIHYGQVVPRLGGTFPMYGNDRLGDCTVAAAGHMEEVWTANAAGRAGLVAPAEQAVLDAYIPGTGAADDGRYLDDVLSYWRRTGIDGRRILAYAKVDVHDRAQVKAALWLFGGLYLGVGLPVTAQTQTTWKLDRSAPAADREPYSWGGHCVNGTGYTTTSGMYLVTWGTLIRMTWAFFQAYVDEAFAIVTTDWLDSPAGHTPTAAGSLDLARLQADLATL